MKYTFSVSLILFAAVCFSQTPCSEGKADGYDCYGVNLMSRVGVLDLGAEEFDGVWINDIWGWTDPETGKEYALVGMTNGTSFVDVTDPVNPVVLGVLKEHNWDQARTNRKSARIRHEGAKSVWRDIKVYQNYAYIVSEDSDHGLQVFDLTDLRDVESIPADFQEAGHYDGIGQAHNVFINEETGFLYAVGFDEGGTCSGGGLHMVDLSDPENPTYAGCYDNDGYTHDTQCVIYNGPDEKYQGKEICFSSNEDTITLTDVTNKSAPLTISRSTYDGVRYVHQGWLTEDQRYFLSNDELDELYDSNPTKTFIWDMINLESPQLIGTFTHETSSIDHNLYIKGSWVFEANYTSGLRILSLKGVANGNLSQAMFFDTYKSHNNPTFYGAWSNYPFFESGNIIVSDITNGLFVLQPVSVGIASQPKDIHACVGDHLDIPIGVIGENLTFQWQIDEGEGFEDILDFERYHSTTTDTLHAHMVQAIQDGNKYRCIITDEFDEVMISEAMTLYVGEVPTAEFSFDGDDDGNYTFTNASTGASSYVWNFGDGESSTDENPSHAYTSSSTFDIELIAYNGNCSDTVTYQTDRIVLSSKPSSTLVSMYPMPVDNTLIIEVGEEFKNTAAKILSIDGHVVSEAQVTQGKNVLDVSPLSPGLYFILFDNGSRSLSRKVIIR